MAALRRLDTLVDAVAWLRARGVRRLVTDSRRVQPGDAFIAWPGYGVDARQFVPAALAAGALACLVEADGAALFAAELAQSVDGVASLHQLKACTGELASLFLAVPSAALDVVAITGTNGKTSSAWWVAQSLSLLGRRCGVVGTLGVGEPPSAAAPQACVQHTGLTTPDPITLQAALRGFADQSFAACAMEASSIGIVEHRLSGTQIDVAVFTNFTQDHLDFHGGMRAYWDAKARLFAWPGLRAAVVNVDDAQGVALAAELTQRGLAVWTCSAQAHHAARLQARHVRYLNGGLAFTLGEGAHSVAVHTALIGDYNVANLLGVMGALRALGVSLHDAASVCQQLTPVPGRMEQVTAPHPPGAAGDPPGGVNPAWGGPALPAVVVDYAHTPDALEKALRALRPMAGERGGRLWVVFGCGGNRDATKRPLMGGVAEREADHVVLTSDNPRGEVPQDILRQIAAGFSGQVAPTVIEDRRAAIAQVIAQAAAADVVLLAGKGHEPAQEIAGEKLPFSDVAEAQSALALRQSQAAPMMTLAHAHALLPGSTLVGSGEVALQRVHSDTRSLQLGDFFVALRGERFDANDFLPQAQASGAVAALAERGLSAAGLPGIEVADSKAALGTLGAAWRARCHLPLIAVTGSNGKTTVTQMIASVLRAWLGEAAFATDGNFNNDIGVPLTLLRLRGHHRAAVVELGMNHPGEIALLAAMAAPTVALVNNAQREHQEFMQSVQAVARENGAVIESLAPTGVAVFPADDAHAPLWHTLAAARPSLTFALHGAADVTADFEWAVDHWSLMLHTPAGFAAVRLHIAGEHNVKNALAAAACALAAGCPLEAIVRGLDAFAPVKGRSQLKAARLRGQPITLVDDTYNANPDSARAAIEVLAQLPGPRWLVLGDMGEVGTQGPEFHREVGAYAQAQGIETLWTAGPLCQHAAHAFTGARHFAQVGDLLAALHEAPASASVLVKGSRFMKMEQVVAALQRDALGAAAQHTHQGQPHHAA